MKIQVLETGSSTRTVEIEIPRERVSEEMERSFSALAKRAKVPGFRQGKVPRAILEKNFAAQVQQDVMERLVPEATFEALKESKLDVVGRPRIENLNFSPDSPLCFKAQVEIKPSFELNGSLSGLKAQAPKGAAGEEAVQKALQQLAERQAIVSEPQQRPAAKGDYVVIDFVGQIDGKPFEGGRAKAFPLVLGSGQTLPGFEESLVGAQPEAKVETDIQFPEDYSSKEVAGKKAHFIIHLKEVRERKLPEINDELAKQLGDFENLEQLKKKVEESIKASAEAERRAKLQEQLADQLVQMHNVAAPHAMVEAELHYLIDRELQSLRRQGMQLADDEASQKLHESLKPHAEKRAKLSLILEKLAARENLSISDEEYKKEMAKMAPSAGMSHQEILRWAADNGREEGIKAKLLEDKAMNWVIEKANVQEVA